MIQHSCTGDHWQIQKLVASLRTLSPTNQLMAALKGTLTLQVQVLSSQD